MNLRFVVCVGGLLCAAVSGVPAESAVWSVAKDGTGDYAVIQDAVDAAAPGDTIRIGAGTFDDVHPIPYWDGYQATIDVTKNGLVLIGSGPDQTIIGTGIVDWYYRVLLVARVGSINVDSLSLSDLTIAGGYNGIHYEGDHLRVARCDLRSSDYGMAIFGSHGLIVSDSVIQAEEAGIGTFQGTVGATFDSLTISGCQFGIALQQTTDLSIRDVAMRDVQIGLQLDWGCIGVAERVDIVGRAGVNTGAGLVVTYYSALTLLASTVDYSLTETHDAVSVTNRSTISGSGNVFRGGGANTLYLAGIYGEHNPLVDFHGNDIYRADSTSVDAIDYNEVFFGAKEHFDLTGNYWGTDDPQQIAAWIVDAGDFTNNADHWALVDFVPYLATPVPTGSSSWGGLKSLFR